MIAGIIRNDCRHYALYEGIGVLRKMVKGGDVRFYMGVYSFASPPSLVSL